MGKVLLNGVSFLSKFHIWVLALFVSLFSVSAVGGNSDVADCRGVLNVKVLNLRDLLPSTPLGKSILERAAETTLRTEFYRVLESQLLYGVDRENTFSVVLSVVPFTGPSFRVHELTNARTDQEAINTSIPRAPMLISFQDKISGNESEHSFSGPQSAETNQHWRKKIGISSAEVFDVVWLEVDPESLDIHRMGYSSLTGFARILRQLQALDDWQAGAKILDQLYYKFNVVELIEE